MNLLTHQKVTNASYLLAATIVLTMPEMIFGLLTEFVYFLFEFSTIVIEYLEIFLDHLIENLFHTNPHQTQVATFYVLTSLGVGCLYFFWRIVYFIIYKMVKGIKATYQAKKMQLKLFWENQTPLHKAKYMAIGTTGIAVLMLFGG